MTAARSVRYRLAPAAEADLEGIWRYTAQTWSVTQADRYLDSIEKTFDTLLSMPEIARERTEFQPPVRVYPSGQHLIIYRIEPDYIAILRVLSGRQNWQALLGLGE